MKKEVFIYTGACLIGQALGHSFEAVEGNDRLMFKAKAALTDQFRPGHMYEICSTDKGVLLAGDDGPRYLGPIEDEHMRTELLIMDRAARARHREIGRSKTALKQLEGMEKMALKEVKKRFKKSSPNTQMNMLAMLKEYLRS